ncbi:hypothetical protein HYV87_04945 [Candidatus Woesearchaeota archaeon]|nr:hypothetical protein [Candidatus Woesearchaeota archaeon]MBI2582443.1 hypothetical protein [Candidatus Woesearchaeota archaeon]
MWQQKILYEGNASGIFRYDAFQLFMEGKGLRIPYRDTPIYKEELFVIEPATTLTYTARKRMIPRDLDVWHVVVKLSGYGVGEVERNLCSRF